MNLFQQGSLSSGSEANVNMDADLRKPKIAPEQNHLW